ncbi:MAG: transketolase, partial [Oscillospiraceae bacterium]|nr:transketolase [Oscillospiraceae bacterium]
NKLQIDGPVAEINSIDPLTDKWKSFGWHVIEIDGHDCGAIDRAISAARAHKGQPVMIVAHTVKGKGVSFVEAAGAANHNMPFTTADFEKALAEIRGDQ